MKTLTYFLLFFTTFTLFAFGSTPFVRAHQIEEDSLEIFYQISRGEELSSSYVFDKLIEFIDRVESGEVAPTSHVITMIESLALRGADETNIEEIQADIAELHAIELLPASWVSKQWKQVKKFVKKHKKAIITTIVVVAVVLVTYGVATSLSAAGAAAGGASTLTSEEIKEAGYGKLEEEVHTMLSQETTPTYPKEETGKVLSYMADQEIPMTQENFLSVRGASSYKMGAYDQAVLDYTNLLNYQPEASLPYLQRSASYCLMGDYAKSFSDFQTYTNATTSATPEKIPFDTLEFSKGFGIGLKEGCIDSVGGTVDFAKNLTLHPINTSVEIYKSCETLAVMCKEGEFKEIAHALAPELSELVTNWDYLESERRGELAGYAVGKYGTDIAIGNGVAKVGSTVAKGISTLKNSTKQAKALSVLSQGKTLALIETAIESPKPIEIIHQAKTLPKNFYGKIAPEALDLIQKSGKMERLNGFAALVERESFAVTYYGKKMLKPEINVPMPESRARQLLAKYDIHPPSRPKGIPEDFIVTISDNANGICYTRPDGKFEIRVMAGMPHSLEEAQHKPYVAVSEVVRKGVEPSRYGKLGNEVKSKTAESHIPIEEFSISPFEQKFAVRTNE